MKRKIMIFCMLLMGIENCLAQGVFQEYIQCQTDKDFYISGERLWFRLWSVNENSQPQQRSRIAYVELVGAEENGVQCMVELKDATGNGVLDLPFALPSGQYQLRAYTRNMLNLGEKAIYTKAIDVMNTFRYEEGKDKVAIVGPKPAKVDTLEVNIGVTTDKNVYGSREKVGISLGNLPKDTRVSVSVARADGRRSYRGSYTVQELEDKGFEPEVESQLVEGKYTSANGGPVTHPNLSFQSPAIHYFPGVILDSNKVDFHTPLLYGVETLYTGTDTGGYIELESPFMIPRLNSLPSIEITTDDEECLQERSMGLQASRYFGTDSLRRTLTPVDGLHKYRLTRHYDMDEYKRFDTFKETFTEYVKECSTTQRNGRQLITMIDEFTNQQNDGNTLVLLNGVAVMNHEDLLKYNPRLCKYMDIYYGHYLFANQVYVGILNVRTPNGHTKNFNLPANTRKVKYNGIQTTTHEPLVCGDEYLTPLPQQLPDTRHTLYWNPDTASTTLECLTSDLKGVFVVEVQGITPDGQKLEGYTTFTVK